MNKPNWHHDIVLRHAPDSSLAEEVHRLDSLNGAPSGAEGTIAHGSFHPAFYIPVVVLHYII
jgi:hypothetical protein